MVMKKLLAFAALVVLSITTVSAHAVPVSYSVTADEFGHGTVTSTTGFSGTLASALAPDPGPGGQPSVLTYSFSLPGALTGGDLLIFDSVGGIFSDVVRFNAAAGTMLFYSNPLDGYDSLADIASPPGSFYANNLTLYEVNGVVTYTPLAGQPGFVGGLDGPLTYSLISDSPVPEPSSLALLGTGILGGIGMVRRRFCA